MKYVLSLCLLAIILSACSNAKLPQVGEGQEEALGSITVSSLAFTPLDSYSDGNRLNYGAMKDEASIRNMIHAASLGISESEFRSFQADFEARGNILGVDATKTIAKGIDGPNIDTEKETIKEITKTPDNAGEGFGEARDPKLKQPSFGGGDFHLSPDEQISLIAAYKMMMVNLEQYYNADSFVNVENKDAKYLPYRVHFTVSMQPGWWTRAQHWEPVIDIKLGSIGEECRILNVTPAETAQTLTQQFSSLRALTLGARIGASYGPVAADAAVNYIKEKTKKLEGIRNNKTAIVGFPDSDTVSIRFRPNYVPGKRFRDLQPVSRVFTATVLVRSDWKNNADSTDKGTDNDDGNDYDDGPTKALFDGKTEVKTKATDTRLSLITESRRLKYTVSSQFEPALEEESNRTAEPEKDGADSLNGIRACYKRNPSGKSDCEREKDERYTLVPIWNTESKKPFAIRKTPQGQLDVEGVFFNNVHGRYSAIVRAKLSMPRYIVRGKVLRHTSIAWRFVDTGANKQETHLLLHSKSVDALDALSSATATRVRVVKEVGILKSVKEAASKAAKGKPEDTVLAKKKAEAENKLNEGLVSAKNAIRKEAAAYVTAANAIEKESKEVTKLLEKAAKELDGKNGVLEIAIHVYVDTAHTNAKNAVAKAKTAWDDARSEMKKLVKIIDSITDDDLLDKTKAWYKHLSSAAKQIKDAKKDGSKVVRSEYAKAAKYLPGSQNAWNLTDGAGDVVGFTSDLLIINGGKTPKGVRLFIEYALVTIIEDEKEDEAPFSFKVIRKLVVGVNLTNRDALPASKPKASKPKEDKKDGGIVITPSEIKIGIKGDVKKDED